MGIDALMEKPLNLPLLLATIARLLAESGTERVQRLTDPGFKTAYLSQPIEAYPKGVNPCRARTNLLIHPHPVRRVGAEM
jgi:hypothetical protein